MQDNFGTVIIKNMAKIVIENQKQLNKMIFKSVIKTIREILNDPDYGLPLTPETVRRLKKSIRSKKAGRLISFDEILKKYYK
mgnify:CR=1 FL=1